MADNSNQGSSGVQSPHDPVVGAFLDNEFVLRDTVDVLAQSLKALGAAGKTVEASRLAAQAWQVLRRPYPKEAERINSMMHYLAQLPGGEAPDPEQHADNEEKLPELDIRAVPHRERHAVIFATFAAMGPGQGFLLVNDHDPRPLYYQFEAEHTGQFTWDYIEQGPRTWRVRIGRAAKQQVGNSQGGTRDVN